MNYRIVQITPVSLTVEIDDQTPFFSEKKREVLINGKAVLETNENVFTVFDLTPNTEYTLSIDGIEVGFKTESVSCILYASSFRKENPFRDDTLRLNLALAYTPKLKPCASSRDAHGFSDLEVILLVVRCKHMFVGNPYTWL